MIVPVLLSVAVAGAPILVSELRRRRRIREQSAAWWAAKLRERRPSMLEILEEERVRRLAEEYAARLELLRQRDLLAEEAQAFLRNK